MEGKIEDSNTIPITIKNDRYLQTQKELISKAQKLYSQHKAHHTRRVYASDWRIFSQWCQEQNISIKSATHEDVALFLTYQFEEEEIHPNTLTRRLAAIKSIYNEQNLPSPTDHPLVRNLLKGIRRDDKAPPSKSKNALMTEILKSLVDLCPTDTLRGLRDKAILLVGFAGAFRRSEISNIHVEDILTNSEGMDISIRKSKTNQEKNEEIIAIVKANDENYCPCKATTLWLAEAKIASGPIFRGITKHGEINAGKLSEDRIYAIVKKYTVLLGFDIDKFSPHSLRSGFITSALENYALPSKVMAQSRHKSSQGFQPYIKHADRYKQHAGKNLL